MDERQRYREVLSINRAIASAEDYDAVLRLVVDRTAAFTGATACMLLLSQEDGLARVVRSVGMDPAKAARLAVPLTERMDVELCDLLGFQARDGFVGVPVIGKEGLMGVLAVYREAPHAVDAHHDDELISAFADQAAIALDNAERVRRLREARDLEASRQRALLLASVTEELNKGVELQQVIDVAIRRGVEVLGRKDGALFLLEPDGQHMRGFSETWERGRRGAVIPLAAMPNTRRALVSLQPHFFTVDEAGSDESAWMRRIGVWAGLIVPLLLEGRCIGFFYVNYEKEHLSPSQDEFEFANAIAAQCALAIDRARMYEALRAEEQKYRSLFENSLDAVYLTRDDGTVLDANRAACRMHDMTVEEIRQRGRAGLVVQDERHGEALKQRAATGQVRAEMTALRKDGTRFPVELESVVVDSKVHNWNAFVIARDITERKRAEEELRAADQRKTEFLGVLSHELRNPLAPIRNSIYLLERASTGSEQATRAREILRRQTEHLTRLVDDLLDITRISHGKIALQRTRADLREIVWKTTDDLHSPFVQAGIELRVDVTFGSVWIDADATRISQVLANLLYNSVKFTPAGGSVSVSVAAKEDAAELRVRDTGVGMEPDSVERMFEPFAQADQSLARTKGGLGLGLALVKGVVELHGGTVEARSEGIGRGTEFLVRLPLGKPETQPGQDRHAGPQPTRRAILVIEDNLDAAQSLADILELDGHGVRLAYDALSGIALAREFRPEVVLCDIGLPDLSGYEVARTLRRDDALQATRLVALSGYAQPEDRQRARDAGFDAHIAKPPDIDKLMSLLANDR